MKPETSKRYLQVCHKLLRADRLSLMFSLGFSLSLSLMFSLGFSLSLSLMFSLGFRV